MQLLKNDFDLFGKSRPIFWGVVIALSIGILGGAATPLSDWYYGLDFPDFQPPNWLFGPAWTTIFALATYAGIKSWTSAPPSKRYYILGIYLLNGFLNIFWSILFFTLRRPDWSLYEIPFLWASIALLIWFARPVGFKAQVALLPYIFWVTFAAILNWSIVQLNAPF